MLTQQPNNLNIHIRVTILESLSFFIRGVEEGIDHSILDKLVMTIASNINKYNLSKDKSNLIYELRCISALFGGSSEEEISIKPTLQKGNSKAILQISGKIFGLLTQVQKNWMGTPYSSDILEEICCVLSKMLRSIYNICTPPIVTSILQLVVEGYKSIPTTNGLSTIISAVEYFGKDQTNQTSLTNSTIEVFDATFELLRSDMTDMELINQFMILISTLLRIAPNILRRKELVCSLFDLAVHCLQIQSINLQREVLSMTKILLFGEHVQRSQEWQHFLSRAFKQSGPQFIRLLILGIVQSGHFSLFEIQSTILYSLLSQQKQLTKHCLTEAFKQPKFPSELFQEEDKQLVLNILSQNMPQRKFSMLMQDLKEVSNGYQTIDALVGYTL
jgi:hypothetical protein